MLVTFGPNVSNLPVPRSEGLLEGVRKVPTEAVNNLNKRKELCFHFLPLPSILLIHRRRYTELCLEASIKTLVME